MQHPYFKQVELCTYIDEGYTYAVNYILFIFIAGGYGGTYVCMEVGKCVSGRNVRVSGTNVCAN